MGGGGGGGIHMMGIPPLNLGGEYVVVVAQYIWCITIDTRPFLTVCSEKQKAVEFYIIKGGGGVL